MQGTTMERSKLQALATELAKDIKSEADLNALSREMFRRHLRRINYRAPADG